MNDTNLDIESISTPNEKISFEDFAKVEMRIGKIISAEIMEKSDKLLKLSVDFGEATPRQVLSGIRRQFQDPNELVERKFVFVTNLEPRKIMGMESQAMILAGSYKIENQENIEEKEISSVLALMTPTIDLPAGTKLS